MRHQVKGKLFFYLNKSHATKYVEKFRIWRRKEGKQIIYTIGRQYGSGGRLIGKAIAEKEQIPFYDNELLLEAARESGIPKTYFDDQDEKLNRHFIQSNAVSFYSQSTIPMDQRVILAQFDAIRQLAKKGPCVFIGRCADYVLRNRPDCVSVFIRAEQASRIERATTVYGVDKEKAAAVMKKIDKNRAAYYNYYTENRWGDAQTYEMVLNSTRLSEEQAADIIIHFARAVKGGSR